MSERTPAWGCPILIFTSPGTGTSGNAFVWAKQMQQWHVQRGLLETKQSKAQHEKSNTDKSKSSSIQKYCIQEKLRQLNLYWKYKNTKFCYVKKLPKPQHSPSVASTSCSLVSPNAVQHHQHGYFGKHMFPIILSKAKRTKFGWFCFSFFLYHLEKNFS